MSRLRIGLAQMNATVGDFAANVEKIITQMRVARDAGADVVAFPELVVCGYPPEDLLLKPDFVAAGRSAVERIARETAGIIAVVGFPERDVDLYNAAAILHDGEWVGTYRKQRLPNYGVFDEVRYFKPGREEALYHVSGAWVGVSICEDLWLPGGPIRKQAQAGADVMLNINASPFHAGKWRERHHLLATRAHDHGIFIAYVNQVGGQDELVFDGGSCVFGPDGDLLTEASLFREELLFHDLEIDDSFRARMHGPRQRGGPGSGPRTVHHVELGTPAARSRPPIEVCPRQVHDDVADVYEALVLGTRDYVRKNGFERVVLGLSGGIDSSLVAAIAVDALGPENVTGVIMPSRFSSEGSRKDAEALVRRTGIRRLELPIEPVHAAFLETLAGPFAGREPDVTEENLQARTRGTLLMALSNKFNWILLTTGNKSELATGYATLYGDMAGGFAVIKDVPKTLVFALSRWRNEQPGGPPIPESVIAKPPSAELRPDQKDTDSLPPYDVLDPILAMYVEEDRGIHEIVEAGHDEALVRRVARMVDASEYKRRQAAPGVKITPRAFGKDRRVPITSRWHDG
ncbi:MAG: NAD+ synthase [Gemmatimonadota bacterium]|jgi:NAD+ synthase (glutamine-hydrolysing)